MSERHNLDAHAHPSMHPALSAYLKTTNIRASHSAHRYHHHSHSRPHKYTAVPPPTPAPAAPAPPDMLSGLLLEDAVLYNATKKANNPIDKLFFLSTMAGIWVGIGGLAGVSAAGGVPESVRNQWLALPKFLLGGFFAFALHFIAMFGGELFTGNTMILAVGYFNKVITLRALVTNWVVVYVGNWAGCLLTSYFLGYLTKLFAAEQYIVFLDQLTVGKLEDLGWGVIFLRAIPANIMVCMALMLGLASRGAAGKIMALWFPVVMFVLSGYEHCVANMFFTSLGLMYGASSTIRRQWYNQSAAVCGNIVGGVIFIGLAEHLMNHWQSPIFRSVHPGAGTLAAHDVESSRRARDVRDLHPADLVARVRSIIYAEHRARASAAAGGAGGNGESPAQSDPSSSQSSVDTAIGTPTSANDVHIDVHPGTPLHMTPGHEEALERRKAMRALLGMNGVPTWFGHGHSWGRKSEKEGDPSMNV